MVSSDSDASSTSARPRLFFAVCEFSSVWATHHLTPRLQTQAAAKAREKARPPKAVPRTAPPAVARADELTDALRSNKATRATGVADLHAALAAAHRPVKRAQPKKQRKLKYRGARLLNRYRERPI